MVNMDKGRGNVVGVQQRGGHRVRNGILGVALLGLAGSYAYDVYQDNECAIEAAQEGVSGFLDCMSEGTGGGSASVTEIGLVTEDMTDVSLNLTFGTVAMQMAGTATFKYDGRFYQNLQIPGIWDPADVERYYNKDNASTTEVEALVCTRFGGDYETALDLNAETPDDGKSRVLVDVDFGADGQTIDSINIDAGILDLCLPNIALTQENENLWSERDWAAGPFADEEWNKAKFMVKDLIVSAALAQTCPEDLLKSEAVTNNIETVVRGALSDSPARAAMVAEAFVVDPATGQDKVTTTFAPAIDRQTFYQQEYNTKRTNYQNGSAFGENIDFDVDISEIAVRNCSSDGVVLENAN